MVKPGSPPSVAHSDTSLPDAPPNFDRLATPYRWMELLTFGPLLQQTRTHFLPHLFDRRQALVLGDGDGRFTAELLRRYPNIQVHAVDGSAAMLHALTHRCKAHECQVTTQVADLRSW